MKFKSQVYTETSGSIGGVTYSHNRGGLYTRARSIPVDPATPDQTFLRSAMAQLSAAWRADLTVAQRTAWEAYALATPLLDVLGEPRNVGGVGMFIRGNVPRLLSGVSEGVVNDGPAVSGLPAQGNITVVVTAPSALSVTYQATDGWVSEDGGALMVYASRGQNQSINFFKGPFRFAGSEEGESIGPPTPPAAVTSDFPYVVGQRVFVRVNSFRADARLSLAQTVQATVV